MLVTYDPYSGTMGRFSRVEILKMVADAGYEGLNLPVREPFMRGDDEADVAQTAQELADHGLQVNTITFGKNECTTPGKHDEMLHWMRVVLRVAGELGASVVGIWPNLPQGVTREVAHETLRLNLVDMLPMADDAGCAIGLEFEKECTLDNYREGIQFIHEVDARIKLTADTYHINNDRADMYEAALAMKDMISDVHISGSHRGAPGSEGDTIDYDAFMKGLAETGYQGDLVLQYKLEDPASMARACGFTEGLRDTLKAYRG